MKVFFDTCLNAKNWGGVLFAFLLCFPSFAAQDDAVIPDAERQESIRLKQPHNAYLTLGWPHALGVMYRYQVDSHWAIGGGGAPLLPSVGVSGRYYLSAEPASWYLELMPAYHFISLNFLRPSPANATGILPTYSLNGRLGWEYYWDSGLSLAVFEGFGLAWVEQSEVWGLMNFGLEFGFSF